MDDLGTPLWPNDALVLLATWARWHKARDQVVRLAARAGVPKLRIHQVTGIGRTTIDRILEREPSCDSPPSPPPSC